jgi:hypothetical protein
MTFEFFACHLRDSDCNLSKESPAVTVSSAEGSINSAIVCSFLAFAVLFATKYIALMAAQIFFLCW